MDPDANLVEQRLLAARIITAIDKGRTIDSDDAYRLAELVQALDDWCCRDGFVPHAWRRR
jgi:hypothetical protein